MKYYIVYVNGFEMSGHIKAKSTNSAEKIAAMKYGQVGVQCVQTEI